MPAKKKRFLKQVSLQSFHRALGRVAKEKGENGYSVEIKIELYETTVVLIGYINGYGFENGKTIREVCDKFRNTKSKIKKVTF